MKIALTQTNPTIGDFALNSSKILRQAGAAAELGCDLAVFPELAVSGYPPLDLLDRESFIRDHEAAVAQLVSDLPDIDVMLGCFERQTEKQGKPLYNSAFVIRNHAVIHKTRKRLLPAYDVFDENRHFEPGLGGDFYRLKDKTIGVTICEDIWHEAVAEYRVDPLGELFDSAAENQCPIDLIINISASPFDRHKSRIRNKIFQDLNHRFQTPFIYVNQVGGQDSLLFDGGSLALDGVGNKIAQAAWFKEDMVIVDTSDWRGEIRQQEPGSDIGMVHDALVMGLRDYVTKSGFSKVVLGLSGGIDSALTCALACQALGSQQVLGVALPSAYSSPESLEDARELARRCQCQFEVIAITDLFDTYRRSLDPLFSGLGEDVTEQNIQARIRGDLLMALSNKFGHLLLTTGNKSEMAVGYCTLYGDMSGGLGVISDVPKQLVYDMARYINRDEEIIPGRILSKQPSAELRPDQTDQDDLPPYGLLDQILERYLEEGRGRDELVEEGFNKEIVDDIVRRIRLNEYKRKQAPIGLKVTSKAFGIGRRLPNVQNYCG